MKKLITSAQILVIVAVISSLALADFPGSPIGGGGGTATGIQDNLIVNADINSSAAIDATKIADGSVTSTEFQYLNGATSAIQTQLNLKAPLASPTFTGTVTMPAWIMFGTDNVSANQNLRTTDNQVANTYTAAEFISSAADNTRGIAVPNTADPTGSNLEAGLIWVTGNVVKVRSNDNTATLQAWTSGAASSLAYATTGSLTGGIQHLDNVSGPTAAQMYGSNNVVNANITVLLPTAVQGMSGCVTDGAATATDIIVDVQAGDNVILVGVTQAGGVGITNASGSSLGDYVCFIATANNKWRVYGKQGTWASQ